MHLYLSILTCVLISSGYGYNQHDASATQTSEDSKSAPVTRSSYGAFRGSWMWSRRGRLIAAYRGIRYVQPPVGELRFKPPILIEHYSSEVNATEDGPECPQPAGKNDPVDEDCLSLNVYTHGNKGVLRPVIVFLHPGGFYSVSSRSDGCGPDYLLDHDVVLVTINYRLASLGFLSTGDKYAPGNNGLKDQVMALRWVQRNIVAFGGDPNLVTIAGYSVGSFSVMLHMISPMSKGLFHRGIAMSGSPISQIVITNGQRDLAVKQAQLSNCSTASSEEIINCLKTKPAREIGDTLYDFSGFAYDPILLWMPVVENDFGQERFLVEQPLDSVRQGRIHAVPLIVSQTKNEFFWKAIHILENDTFLNEMNNDWHRVAPIAFSLPASNARTAADKLKEAYLGGKALANDKESVDGLGKLYNDGVIGFGVHRMANLMCQYSPHSVYYYQFAYIGNHSYYEDPVTKKPVGAAHHDDLIYLFSKNNSFPLIKVSDSLDSLIVDKMTSIWYNFARFGNPNPRDDEKNQVLSGLCWPAMTPEQRKYLRIDKDFPIQENLFENRFTVWDGLYPMPK